MKPLSDIFVLDLSRVLAGPYCTMQLYHLGARIVKVEIPGLGDDSRAYGPFMGKESGYFASLNHGKESIALNLKNPADRDIFERLLARADVLVENFRPGAMAKLGYGWEDIKERYPRLVYAAISGFGQTGPYAGRPAYDMIVQAMSGIMNLTGYPDQPPARVGISIGDIGAGIFASMGILAALYEREHSGNGRFIDIAMLDCQIAMLENALARYFATGKTPHREGSHHPSIAPFGAFATADQPIVIACGNDHLFKTLCQILGHSDWSEDPRFKNNESRSSHCSELQKEIEKVLMKEPADQWLKRLTEASVPCGPINDIASMVGDPQIDFRRMIIPIADPNMPNFHLAGLPIKFDDEPYTETLPPAPKLDEHREKLLIELGLI